MKDQIIRLNAGQAIDAHLPEGWTTIKGPATIVILNEEAAAGTTAPQELVRHYTEILTEIPLRFSKENHGTPEKPSE